MALRSEKAEWHLAAGNWKKRQWVGHAYCSSEIRHQVTMPQRSEYGITDSHSYIVTKDWGQQACVHWFVCAAAMPKQWQINNWTAQKSCERFIQILQLEWSCEMHFRFLCQSFFSFLTWFSLLDSQEKHLRYLSHANKMYHSQGILVLCQCHLPE